MPTHSHPVLYVVGQRSDGRYVAVELTAEDGCGMDKAIEYCLRNGLRYVECSRVK